QPTINPSSNLELCDDDSNDGFEEFDLSEQTPIILGTQSATDFTVTYHLSFADADSGDNVLPLTYTNTENPQPIYVRVESLLDSGCYNASAAALFDLVVNTRAIASPPEDMEVCDDVSNDGQASFDLSTQEAAILDGQSGTIFDVSFHNSQDDANSNVGALSSTSTLSTQTVYARVEDPLHPDCYGTTSFEVIVNPLPELFTVTALQVCDDDTDEFVGFPLSDKEPDFVNGQADVVVSFHETPADAMAGVGALSDGYVNTNPVNQTIHVRLENTITNCYNINTLDLEVLANPLANGTTPLEVCDDDADGFAEFDLSLKDAEVIGTQTDMSVTYYLNETNALGGNSPLPISYTNETAYAQEIYARIANNLTGCSAITTLQLIVNPKPTTIAVTAYELCDDNNPGDEEEVFDLNTKTAEILDGQVNVDVSYYASPADAEAEVNAITSAYTNLSNPQPIIAVLTNTLTGCSSTVGFDLIVNPLPILVVPTALEVCDDGTPDGITEMDLSLKNGEITNYNPAYSVSYYETAAEAISESNPLPVLYT
ncbi:hypothetical protein HNV10_17065, partial [Winogradskyella litoriviva]|nr:hypothetical protein [Winogradskyella litoriviva]